MTPLLLASCALRMAWSPGIGRAHPSLGRARTGPSGRAHMSDPLFVDSALLKHRIDAHNGLEEIGNIWLPVLRSPTRECIFSMEDDGQKFIISFESELDAYVMCLVINTQREGMLAGGEEVIVESAPAIDVWDYVQRMVLQQRVPGKWLTDEPVVVSLAVIKAGELRALLHDDWIDLLMRSSKGDAEEATAAAASAGCTDEQATNFSPFAEVDDGSCLYTF
ncbi:hypothetical protein T492DRAFT_844890 [Pavlovales sp. CCMP2436]|nr:hypothetical protein T492DRAFT_844890 [Pavlovales sp. CCMP2436]